MPSFRNCVTTQLVLHHSFPKHHCIQFIENIFTEMHLLSSKTKRLEHLLWALMVLKLYTGQKPLCSLAGVVDPETFCKSRWDFVEAVAQLDWLVASTLGCSLHFYLKISLSMTKGMIASCLLMEQIFQS